MKILFVCTEDWFFHTHFAHIARFLIHEKQHDVVLVANKSAKSTPLEDAGIKVIPLDFKRSSLNFILHIHIGYRLWQIIRNENPDIVHFIAFKPIIIGGLSSYFFPAMAKVYHLTGQGFFIVNKTVNSRFIRKTFLKFLSRFLKNKNSWLLIENMDDLEMVQEYGQPEDRRFTILGGAGVNQKDFLMLPPPENNMVHIAFVGRLVWSKGCDVLIEAIKQLQLQGLNIKLDIYGEMDVDNPRVVNIKMLNEWKQHPHIEWHGKTNNIIEVWSKADIGVFPSRGGEGLPRAMLEAAASGRPLIVTDVPGCRHFVRDGVEGYIVQPEDITDLAEAIRALVVDREMRIKMGCAARKRILEGFTEDHVQKDIEESYHKLLKKTG